MKTYNYFTFGAFDEYGQQVLSTEPEGQVKMAVNILSQTVADSIKYKESEYIGLTFNNSIDDSWAIAYGETKLKVLYVNPMGRYKQVFLKQI